MAVSESLHPTFDYEITAAERAMALFKEVERIFTATTNSKIVEDKSFVYGCVDLILLTDVNNSVDGGQELNPVIVDNDFNLLMIQLDLHNRNAQEFHVKKSSKQIAMTVQLEPVAATVMANALYAAQSTQKGVPLSPLPQLIEIAMKDEGVFIDDFPLDMVDALDHANLEDTSTLAKFEAFAGLTRNSPIVLA